MTTKNIIETENKNVFIIDGEERNVTEIKLPDGTSRKIGFKHVWLDKDEYDLDKTGWIWVRSRLKVKDALIANRLDFENLDNITEWLSELVQGWELFFDDNQLDFKHENYEELPIQLLSFIQQSVSGNLDREPQTTQTDSETSENE